MDIPEARIFGKAANAGRVKQSRRRLLLLAGATLVAGGLTLPGLAAAALPNGSIFVKQFNGLWAESGLDTFISASEYTCGIFGLAGLDGDINEDDDGDIIYVYLYTNGGSWWVKADFRSHSGDHEHWNLTVLCADNDVISVGGPSSKPLFVKTYTHLGDNVSYDTGFSTSSWVCGIVGFEALDGDINENGAGTIMRMYMFQQSGRWRIRADFRTHHDDENWARVDVLCASTSVATIGTPTASSSKQVFLKEYNGLASNGFYNTGISDSSFVCGVVGMEAYDGDIEEHDSGDIIQAYAYRQSGKWWIRTDFRTHNDHENWNIDLLCIDQPAAEDQGSWPPPFKGVTTSSSTSNRCVDVATEFSELERAGAEFHVKLDAGTSGLGDGHYQGVARLNNGTDYIALSRGRKAASGQVLVVRMSSPAHSGHRWLGRNASEIGASSFSNYEVNEITITCCQHPGGLSVIGDYLTTGAEDCDYCPGSEFARVFIWDLSDPASESEIFFPVDQQPSSDFGRQQSDDGANSATVAKLTDGTYVAVAGGRDNNIIYFFSGSSLSSNQWSLDYIWEESDSSTRHGFSSMPNVQSWQWAVDCSTRDLYLVGTDRYTHPIWSDENEAYLFLVTREYRRSSTQEGYIFHLTYAGGESDFDYQNGAANFDAGATPFITGDGDLVIYSVEKCKGANCPGGYNRIRIVQHWGDNNANCKLTSETCLWNSDCCSGVCGPSFPSPKCDMLE